MEIKGIRQRMVIYFADAIYSKNKDVLKRVMTRYGLKWNYSSSSWEGTIGSVLGEFEGHELPVRLTVDAIEQFVSEFVPLAVKVGGEVVLVKVEEKKKPKIRISSLQWSRIDLRSKETKNGLSKRFVRNWIALEEQYLGVQKRLDGQKVPDIWRRPRYESGNLQKLSSIPA